MKAFGRVDTLVNNAAALIRLRLVDFTEELLSTVAQTVTGSATCQFGEHAISFAAPFRRLSLRHAAAEEASRRLGRTITAETLRTPYGDEETT